MAGLSLNVEEYHSIPYQEREQLDAWIESCTGRPLKTKPYLVTLELGEGTVTAGEWVGDDQVERVTYPARTLPPVWVR